MVRRSESRTTTTRTLPNGNHVTVRVGFDRSGSFKKVTVRWPSGESKTVTYRRGPLGSYFLGNYTDAIPGWARR